MNFYKNLSRPSKLSFILIFVAGLFIGSSFIATTLDPFVAKVWAAIIGFERQPSGTPVAGEIYFLTLDPPAQKGVTVTNVTDSDEPVYLKPNDNTGSPQLSEDLFTIILFRNDVWDFGPEYCKSAGGISNFSVLCETTPTLMMNGRD